MRKTILQQNQIFLQEFWEGGARHWHGECSITHHTSLHPRFYLTPSFDPLIKTAFMEKSMSVTAKTHAAML